MTILVTGGAGYIGAHVVEALTHRSLIVVDDFSTGSADRIPGVDVVEMDIAAPWVVDELAELMRKRRVRAVVHLAARKRVDESVARPLYYYQQNIDGLHNVLNAMVRTGVRRLVFSSSAAVYGETSIGQVPESGPMLPVNPYGRTKLVGEWLCRDLAAAGELDVVALRYFNVAGAGRPELGDPAVLNLVTMVIDRLRRGEAPIIFGEDYLTPDGTCVRDFIHVADLADAHGMALEALMDGSVSGFEVFNVGTGRGASVRQVVHQLVELSGLDIEPVIAPRRAGDPATVVASVELVKQRLGWRTQSDLECILTSAWEAN